MFYNIYIYLTYIAWMFLFVGGEYVYRCLFFFSGGGGMGISANLGTRYTLLPSQEACTRKAACVVLDEEDQPQAGFANQTSPMG